MDPKCTLTVKSSYSVTPFFKILWPIFYLFYPINNSVSLFWVSFFKKKKKPIHPSFTLNWGVWGLSLGADQDWAPNNPSPKERWFNGFKVINPIHNSTTNVYIVFYFICKTRNAPNDDINHCSIFSQWICSSFTLKIVKWHLQICFLLQRLFGYYLK